MVLAEPQLCHISYSTQNIVEFISVILTTSSNIPNRREIWYILPQNTS